MGPGAKRSLDRVGRSPDVTERPLIGLQFNRLGGPGRATGGTERRERNEEWQGRSQIGIGGLLGF